MKKATLKQKFSYWFDNMMSRGTPAMIGMLFVASAVIIVLVALIVVVFRAGPGGTGFGKLIWMSLMRTLDPGTMGGDEGSPFFLFMMLVVTIGGLFVVSALIGVINTGLETQLGRMRKGRSRVLESGHTLILGWSSQIFTIISELMIANENQSRASIVILAIKDKVEMEDEIRELVVHRGGTRVICRSGSPIDLNDLEIVSPHTAKSIIVLPSELVDEEPDARVIKTVLALTNNPNRREGKYHIVTEINEPANMDIIKLIGAKDDVLVLQTRDLIARVVAQTSHQSGLSVVYTELMDFQGDEIYFKNEPSLVGKTYREVLMAFEDSTVMGTRKADGSIHMNPPMDFLLEPGEEIFAISEDDDTINLSYLTEFPIDSSLIRTGTKAAKSVPEKTLILGWNRCASIILRELDEYVAPGSRLTVVAEGPRLKKEINICIKNLKKQKAKIIEADITNRAVLDDLKIMDYNHVIVLAYRRLGVQHADAMTLTTLLHLRDISEKDETPFSIVSEMLDLRNRELAEAAKVDDFIVSGHLISLMLAQLSENKNLFAVFQDIFDPKGSEIYLKPVGDYVATGQPVNFYTVIEAARQRGETAIGYRLSVGENVAPNYGVVTNPRKSQKVTFSPGDRVIVIAED
jgi:voltage-gated potassium channel Kch